MTKQLKMAMKAWHIRLQPVLKEKTDFLGISKILHLPTSMCKQKRLSKDSL
jgi:hypothetical protein